MHGKKKCKILKEIRKQIAKDNDITYVTTECKHQGNCKGTCPKCEAEVRYLEAELEKRRMAGKQVVVAGIAAAMMMSASCTPEPEDTRSKTLGGAPDVSAPVYSQEVDGEMLPTMGDYAVESSESVYSETVDGLMEPPSEEESVTMGEPSEYAPESSEELVQGDVPLPGEVPEESSEEELWEGEIIEDSEVELGGDPLPWPEEN
ncbi:MAG: hypothetical protein IKT91_05230 [Clostridia bacterium]|nr:hypothetical protein [Clostridia bacterium]